MKKLFLIAGGILLSTTVLSAPIPGVNHFSYWNDFKGMFNKIYTDTQELDVAAICERVLEWPDFLDEEGELIFSLEDCEELVKSGVSSFVNTHSKSLTQTEKLSNALEVKYSFEKQLWQEEYDLQRQVALAYIWNDGDGGANPENNPPAPKERTSPVDLVFRWNEIENILFGVLTEYPEFASFKESTDDIFDPWEEEPTEDPWLDQREKVFSYAPWVNYSAGEKSITGGYEELARMFEEKLNAFSLISGKMTTQTLDAPFTGSCVPNGIGMNVDGAAAPAVSPDIPAQIAIQEKVPTNDGIFPIFFRQQAAEELRNPYYISRKDSLNQTLEDSEGINDALSNLIDTVSRYTEESRDKELGLAELLPLEQFNTTLDVWISNLKKWKSINEEFITHTAY